MSESYDRAFYYSIALHDALESADSAQTEAKRKSFAREAIRLGNKITPANKQAAIKLRRFVVEEARKWLQTHHGKMNVTKFIQHFRSLPLARWYAKSGRFKELSDSSIRKTISNYAYIKGKAGRPAK